MGFRAAICVDDYLRPVSPVSPSGADEKHLSDCVPYRGASSIRGKRFGT